MNINQLGKISQIAVAGAIFASAISDTFLELTNYKQVTFLIESGEGTAADITITLEAKAGADGTAAAIPFMYMEKGDSEYETLETATFGIGGIEGESKYAVITVTAPMLAKGEYDRVAINTTAADASTVTGSIIAIQTQPRYEG